MLTDGMSRWRAARWCDRVGRSVFNLLESGRPSEQIEKMWRKKSAVLKKIIKAKGGNKYDLDGDK